MEYSAAGKAPEQDPKKKKTPPVEEPEPGKKQPEEKDPNINREPPKKAHGGKGKKIEDPRNRKKHKEIVT